ncbi:kinesin-related protein 10 [Manduca sexta]|uniref:kinesin-related protein 10 n=1 Tax=Manduca sexta TaxID=7130 RepID=UPI00188F1AB7|nr:kinesin-related protein 10 [Manduca sexta]
MPRKRRKNISVIKQKKAIETRLIQISLIMDDYVYQQREISQCDATSYIEEISLLKSKCNNDSRTLQVIEKLTRCMKAIINEHRKRTENDYDLNNEQITSKADSESTVASQINFDKNNFTQSIPEEINTVPREINHCNDIIDLCEEINHKDSQDTNSIINNNDGNKYISELFIVHSKDKDNFSASSHIDDSRSMLDNYQDVLSQDLFTMHTQDEDQNIDTDNSQNTSNKELINEKQPLENSYPNISNYTEMNCSQNILSDHDFADNDLLNMRSQIENTPTSQNIINPCKSSENHVKIFPKVGVNLANTDKLVEKDHLGLVNVTTNKISDRNLDKFDIPVNSVLKPAANITDTRNREVTKAKKAPRKRKVSTKSQVNDITKEVKCKPRKKKDIKPRKNNNKDDNSIYENSVDLSWVENIKYVREISKAENHTRTKDLSHSFWENYSLPNDWDDGEF